jgi:molybdopterin molybdotransferase
MARILKHAVLLRPKQVRLEECLGLRLAVDLYAREPHPRFDNSAVDGYALSGSELASHAGAPMKFRVSGEVKAGDFPAMSLRPGCAMRIFTGAPVPRGTFAVVMQEDVERRNGHIVLQKKGFEPRENIRRSGEDFKAGKRILAKGTLLEPPHLALAAAVGCRSLRVGPQPEVSILATGNELSGDKGRPRRGKIRDSNSILLQSLAAKLEAHPTCMAPCRDSLRELIPAIRTGLASHVFLISGGVSVGKYDLVREALKREGVREIFWKVDIKPGKPLFFGKRRHTLVFGLPGNPVSVFVTFEEFVKPALLMLQGKKQEEELVPGRMDARFENGSRLHFVRVRCNSAKGGLRVVPLKGQGSHMLGSLAASNGLLKVRPYACLRKGQRVWVKLTGEVA